MKVKFKNIFKGFKTVIISNVCIAVLGTTVLGASIGEVKSTINVRKTPYDTGVVVGAVYPGEKVTIQKNNNGWYYVSKDGKNIGWVSGDYVKVTQTNVGVTSTPKTVASKTTKASTQSSPTANTATNVRSSASANSKLLTAIYQGDKVTVLSKAGDWYQVKLSNNTIGYVMAKYIDNANIKVNTSKPSNTIAKAVTKPQTKVTAKAVVKPNVVENYTIAKTGKSKIGVNVRQSPNTSAKVLASSETGSIFSVLGRVNDWYKVKLQNNVVGYISSSYVTVGNFRLASRGSYGTGTTPKAVNQTVTQTDNSDAKVAMATTSTRASKAVSIIDFGKKYLGTQYVYGGTTPSGFDCSGFVLYVCSHFGISLPRTAQEQATVGTYVEKANLATGDLVFFDTSGNNTGSICHVGIYIGNGQFIHSSSGGGHVMISDLSSGFYASAYVKAKRVF